MTDGVYYFVIEPEFLLSAPSNGTITTTVYGSEREIGEDFSRPLDIGTFNSDFSIVAGVEYFSSYMMDYRDDPFCGTNIVIWFTNLQSQNQWW